MLFRSGIAGLRKYAAKGYFTKGATVAVTLTGHGLKDPDTAISNAPAPLSCEASFDAVMKIVLA